MPAKNAIKPYIENGYYHIYNRGVEKRSVFQDRQDYTKFLYILKIYLSPTDELRKEFPLLRSNIVRNNLSEQIDLLAFCLMPNHFHLLIKQTSKDAITKLMRYLLTTYTMYFNKRHGRVGPLFQGVYKGALVDSDEYLLHLSRYIHLNPLSRGASLDEFEWSSYLYYLSQDKPSWLKIETINNYFNEKNPNLNYKNFVEVSNDSLNQNISLPKEILIEENEK